MAASGQKWRRQTTTVVYIVVISIWMDIHGLRCSARNFTNATSQTLCQAQCEALCLDHVYDYATCEKVCSKDRQWVSECEEPVCKGTCSVLQNDFESNQDKLPARPNITIGTSGSKDLELSWQNTGYANLTTIYIIEETRPITSLPGLKLQTYKIIGWVRNTGYRLDGYAVCSLNSYRVMAINRYGSVGFSALSHSLGLNPGPITKIRYVGAGVYFYKDADPTQSEFMAILQWDNPQGWRSLDIRRYEWNHMPQRYCQELSHDSLPMFHRMENQTNHVLLTIGAHSIGCIFTAQVRAISTCNVTGPWTDFKIDLTDCNRIAGYQCPDAPFDPPGSVENVTLSISATPMSVIMQWFKQPYSINSHTDSPLLINLHISWKPPTDLGSENTIDNYIIRSGKVNRNLFPIPPTFVGTPSVKNVSSNIGELIFQLPTSHLPYEYGVQVVAVAPNQACQSDWDILPMYTIQVDRNQSLSSLKKKGKILLDEAGIVIVYINNTLPVSFVFDSPHGKSDNMTVNRYALQWGPLVGPNSREIMVENKTVVPVNQTSIRVVLQEPKKMYGIKIRRLYTNETEADDEASWEDVAWDDVPTLSFIVPDTYEGFRKESAKESSSYLTAVYVTLSVFVAFLLSMLLLCHMRKKTRFKHLERLLSRADDGDVDSLDGDHYFIMRSAGDQSPEPEEVSTVVTDRWELPHSCIKVGRVLGSGAFGQVVKGRVSRTVLTNRGIDFHGQPGQQQARQGTHLTVAVKMLQECPDEKCSQDFLKEIQMMKKIGYHRNIVSMLGCCTLREPYCLLVEYIANGDLQTHLRKIRQEIEKREAESGPYVNQEVEMFSPHNLLSFARQIVTGMDYLSQKGFVHRDLAARNILVGDNSTVKIADFGLARYIYHDMGKVYVNRHGGKLPLKWMAPESISDMTFSTASDVWSFGILLFEIVTLGAVPYPNMSNTELLQALKQGYVMKKPNNCSNEIYDVMKSCWGFMAGCRPSFNQLRDTFTAMLEQDSGLEYFDFKVHEDRFYYRIDSDEMDQDGVDGLGDGQAPSAAGQDTLRVLDIVEEIPAENCTIVELTKEQIQRDNASDDMTNNTEYSDKAFKRNASTTSSFHNELYQDMDDELIGLPTAKVRPDITEGEDISTGSDDVFMDCQACVHSKWSDHTDTGSRLCQLCLKRDIKLKHLGIRSSERNDSAIGSDSSSLRYHTDSSNSSVNSNEYIMPDSPIEVEAGGVVTTTAGNLSYREDPRKIYDYHFVNLQTDLSSIGNIATVPCNVDDETGKESNPSVSNMSPLSPSIVIRSERTRSGEDVWCIAETKL